MKEDSKSKGSADPTATGNTARTLRERRTFSPLLDEAAAKELYTKRSRRSFLFAAFATLVSGLGFRWLMSPRGQGVFDRIGRYNEMAGRKIFSGRALAPEFPRSQAKAPRVNGTEGMSERFDPAQWRLQVVGLADPHHFPQYSNALTYEHSDDATIAEKFPGAPVSGVLLSLDDIKALPRVEMTTELKCIEGWSVVVNWAGVRMTDFVAKYSPAKFIPSVDLSTASAANFPAFVSLITPDRGYYVGWDTPSILHPQTILCYEMNGEPLTLSHGGPLRLVSTAKYGIKQIKRIGRITFTDRRPPDYWAEQGYDWYSGL